MMMLQECILFFTAIISGNVSAHTGHLVASALSDLYYSISAMTNGLAGPLHGLANQEVLAWIQGVYKQMDGKIPTEAEMRQFVWDTLKGGQVIPGFGHLCFKKNRSTLYGTKRVLFKTFTK